MKPRVRVQTDGTPQNTRVWIKLGRQQIEITNVCTLVEKEGDNPFVHVALIGRAARGQYGKKYAVQA